MGTRVLAADLGATSVRVAVVELDTGRVEIVRRVAHHPVQHPDGSLRWDWQRITAAVWTGLELGLAGGPVASIGVDAWAVDYGLLDAGGGLLSPPYCYRDARTARWRDTLDAVGAQDLYRLTGIAALPINTVFQLAVHDRAELRRAARLLTVPELVVHGLTGAVSAEPTTAGATGLVDVGTGTWSGSLLEHLDLPGSLFPAISPAGTRVGTWRGVPVHLVAGHDTASAVATVADGDGTAYLATGSWFLVGTRRDRPELGEAARLAAITNEPGADGGIRFLKNLTGLVLLERCRQEWGDPPVGDLLAEAAGAAPGGLFDPDDPGLLAPGGTAAAASALAGLPQDAPRGRIVRSVVASLAAATARIVEELAAAGGQPVRRLHVLGGGVRNELLLADLTAMTGRPLVIGSPEAAVLGNAMVQGVALGAWTSLAQARRAVCPAG